MLVDVIGVAVLAVTFVLGTVTRVNMGALALVGAFGVGLFVLGEDLTDVLSGFPTSFFLLIFGITYLFSVAGSNGTTDRLVRGLARGVRGRPAAVPWMLFAIGATVVSLGGPGQAIAGIVAPIGLALAARYRISPTLPAIMLVIGVCAGAFSPISILGIVANGQAARSGLPESPIPLYLVTLGFGVGIAIVAFLVLGGPALLRLGRHPGGPAAGGPTPALAVDGPIQARSVPAVPDGVEPVRGVAVVEEVRALPASQRVPHTITVAVILGVALGALVFGADIGVSAICGAVLLHLVVPGENPTRSINWDVLLLICGVLTLIGVLQRGGTVDRLGEAVGTVGSPAVGVLIVSLVAALVSAFASSTATLGILIPVAATLVPGSDLAPLAVLCAVALSTTLVDVSPLSSGGALVVAGAPPDAQRPLFRAMLAWAMTMVVVVPVLAWGLLVLPL